VLGGRDVRPSAFYRWRCSGFRVFVFVMAARLVTWGFLYRGAAASLLLAFLDETQAARR
jgi:hypothetical protein